MYEFFPLIAVGAVLGVLSILFIAAYLSIRKQKEAIGFDRYMKDSEITKRLLVYAKPYWKQFAAVLCVMLFSVAYDIIAPILMGNIIEILKENFEMKALLRLVLLYGVILVVSLICTYVQAIILQRTGQKIISRIREDLFAHIENLSHNQLHSIPVGKLVTRVTNDTGAISMMFTNLIVNLIKNCFIIIGVLIAMLCLNYMLTLMVLCFVPFIVLFTIVFRKFSRKAYRRVKDGTTDINTFLSENLSGMKIIQIFNREEYKKSEFDEKNKALGRSKLSEMLVFSIFRPLVYMLYIASVLCLLYLAGRGYIKDFSFLGQTITSGLVVTFYSYINKFFNPIQNLAEQFNWLQSAFASAEKIFTIFDMEPEVKDAPDAEEMETMEGNIEFRDVWFAYKPEEWVLKGVSFTVKAGETVAFVGSTGSGKTTILSLLCRNYDIQKGQILVDGRDIRTIRKASLRRHFGQMLQDVFLFSGTIRSNILLGLEGVSDEAVMEACRYVNADHFIDKLTAGLDEPVRDRGNNFSAGQRQLLSFARTIVHKPAVMILDEATANIDTETELLIQNSLEKMMNIGTMLMVAHRLSTIQHADKIIVLSHGKILEEGSHSQLLEQKGRYYELYRMQFEKEKLKQQSV
ncbi:MAG: ABC transporter ATP-binding protein [Clostridia bacterium]|nr:ABC transporter ATP-binding protein [Clostridia bacterium]